MSDKNKERAVEGLIIESLPAATFRVKISENEEAIVYLSGKMRKHHIKVLPGDKVLVELSPDRARGRIVRRL